MADSGFILTPQKVEGQELLASVARPITEREGYKKKKKKELHDQKMVYKAWAYSANLRWWMGHSAKLSFI